MEKSISDILVFMINGKVDGYSLGCSTFFFDHAEGCFLGANIDYPTESFVNGPLILNRASRRKEPIRIAEVTVIPWVSRFASLTFSQFGINLPNAGINEAGLALAPMSLPSTEYPKIDSTPRLILGQWKQYVLDSFATVEDVIIHIGGVLPVGHKSHFLIDDAEGDCAAVEFLGGEVVCRRSADLEIKGITNHSYADCIEFYKPDGTLREANLSLKNFASIARGLQSEDLRKSEDPVASAFDILQSSSKQGLTQRSTVYDISNRRIFFRTEIRGPIRSVDMNALSIEKSGSSRMIQIAAESAGDISHTVQELTREVNIATARAFSHMLLKVVPADQKSPPLQMTFGDMMDSFIAYSAKVAL